MVVSILDKIKQLGFIVEVEDEGGYWEKRDINDLVKEVREYNEYMASILGAMKDATPTEFKIESPISHFPILNVLK